MKFLLPPHSVFIGRHEVSTNDFHFSAFQKYMLEIVIYFPDYQLLTRKTGVQRGVYRRYRVAQTDLESSATNDFVNLSQLYCPHPTPVSASVFNPKNESGSLNSEVKVSQSQRINVQVSSRGSPKWHEGPGQRGAIIESPQILTSLSPKKKVFQPVVGPHFTPTGL